MMRAYERLLVGPIRSRRPHLLEMPVPWYDSKNSSISEVDPPEPRVLQRAELET